MTGLYPHWRDIPIDTHNCHLAITACSELDETARAMLAALRKYEEWCSADIVRGKYGSPARVRELILEDARAAIAQAEAAGIIIKA
jgi:hypothetical protein